MKLILNPDYIKYKVFFILAAFEQSINENLIKLFIKVAYQTYFPSFMYIYGTHFVFMYKIRLPELVDKIFGALKLATPK